MSNCIDVVGRFEREPIYEFSVGDEEFYCTDIAVKRLSEQVDLLPVVMPKRVMDLAPLDGLLRIKGNIRSHNVYSGGKNRLKLNIFAKEIVRAPDREQGTNDVYLEGVICKPPVYRQTPLDREITDILLAVGRNYGKSDYIPCIVWGKNAKLCRNMATGTKVRASGRFQSRLYQKVTEDGTLTKTAYELSVSKICLG